MGLAAVLKDDDDDLDNDYLIYCLIMAALRYRPLGGSVYQHS